MENESLWGWLTAGLLIAALGAGGIAASTSAEGGNATGLLIGGGVIAVIGSLIAMVGVIALGVQMGMDRHIYLRDRGDY
jgi:FtsH-binding integral membrane protein